jgi:hypothetical protein
MQQENNLHSLVDEMARWRDIIGNKYQQYKQEKIIYSDIGSQLHESHHQ